MPEKPKTKLSASRIKTAQSCSWLYHCKYKLKLPDTSNDGANRGTTCHAVLEVLGHKRHRKKLRKIMKSGDIFSVPSVERMVMTYARKLGVDDPENVEMMKEFTFNGLAYDFLGNDFGRPTQSISEKAFDITVMEGDISFCIRGFIDKLFLYKGKKFALIRDFKTSKKAFVDSEIADNLQDWIYTTAVDYLFPEYTKTQSEFLFLKFDLDSEKTKEAGTDEKHVEGGVVRMAPITKDELEGFKYELTSIQKYLDSFDESTARTNMASRKNFPSDGSFSGRLLCGFASEKGELKKDGNPKWHCPMKFDFWYYKIFDKDGEFVTSVHEEGFDESMVPDGGCSEMLYYGGCPSFRS